MLETLAEDGTPYTGFIYVGLVLTDDGPRSLQFNCRLGDPETQVELAEVDDDLLELLLAALNGTLAGREVNWFDGSAVDVVLAADGYPESPRRATSYRGLRRRPETTASWSSIREPRSTAVTWSPRTGRVINVVGTAATADKARARAYTAAAKITWEGVQYRRDIAGAELQFTNAQIALS